LNAQVKIPSASQVKPAMPTIAQPEAAKRLAGTTSQSRFATVQAEVKAAQTAGTPYDMLKVAPALFGRIPGPIKQAFNNAFSLVNVKFEEKPTLPAVKCEGDNCPGRAQFTGTLKLGNLAVEASLNVYEDPFKRNKYSLVIQLPQNYKLSQIIPKLKLLDSFSLPRSQFVISDFGYTNQDGVSISEGVNLISLVDLSGPFKLFGELKNKAKDIRSIIVDMSKPVQLIGVIPLSLDSFAFKVVIPIRFGIDFRQIQQIPSGFSNFLRQITTDDFLVKLNIKPTEQIVALQNGIRISIGTQRDPIVLQAFGTIDLTSGKFSIGGKMPSMIEMVWLAIGDLGVEFFVDPGIEAVLVALGVPISGIGLRGRIDIGKANDRASLEVWTKVSLETKKAIDAIFYVSASNINFTNLIVMLTQMAAKARITSAIPVDSIPTIKLNKLSGRLAPWGGSVAGKSMEAGFALEVDATLFDQNFGFLVDIQHKDLKMTGKGWMPPIKLMLGGKTVFQFTGAGRDLQWNTADDGPYVHFDFDAKRPLEGAFALSGMFEMPALALKQQIDLLFTKHRYKATIESSAIGFTVRYDVNIDPVKWREMYAEFSFKDDFDKFISQQAIPALEALKKEASAELSAIDKKIGDFSADVGRAKASAVSDTQREIDKTRATINRIQGKINALKKECADAGTIAKAWVCPKVGIGIAAQGTALAAQTTYLEALLKPGKTVVAETTGAFQAATKGLADAQILKTTVEGVLTGITQALDGISKGLSIFKIREGVGRLSAQDIASGKLSLIKKLVMEVNVPGQKKITITLDDVTFDFTKPAESAQEIAKKLLKPAVKIG
jgi:hypothetical protein